MLYMINPEKFKGADHRKAPANKKVIIKLKSLNEHFLDRCRRLNKGLLGDGTK